MKENEYPSIPRGAPGMLEWPNGVERLSNGNTLIADGGDITGLGSEAVEVDPLGNIVWQYDDGGGLFFLHSARLLKNNNILMTDTSNDRVIEVNRDKQIVFTTEDWGNGTGTLNDGSHLAYPNDARELREGILLITDRCNDRCLKVNRQGEVIWQFSGDMLRPHNATSLPDGNVLICDSDRNRILEISPAKEIVWSYGDGGMEMLNWPRAAVRLDNNNTVICDSKNSRVIEITPDGEVVWKYEVDYFSKFYDIQVLGNGNVLVSDTQHHQVIEVDPSGNYQWLYRNFRLLGIEPQLKNGFFKERNKEGLPSHWNFAKLISETGGKLIWDDENRPYPCPGLEYNNNGFLYLQQLVAVTPNCHYKLAGKIKTDSVKGSCSFQMCFLDKYGGQIYDMEDIPKGDLYIGDNDWMLDTIEATAPKNASCLELRLTINGTGKVWFKDIMLHT